MKFVLEPWETKGNESVRIQGTVYNGFGKEWEMVK